MTRPASHPRTPLHSLAAITLALALGAACWSSDAAAQPRLPAPAWLHGVQAPSPDGLGVLLELSRSAGPAELAQLAQAGVALRLVSGAPLAYGRFVAAHVEPSALPRIASLPIVARVHLAPPPARLPLERSAERIGLEAARGARPDGERFTGRGVVIADIDAGLDVFHPAFFFADAGWYDWVDVDGDGRFRAGVDGIDLDGDGAISTGEIARVLAAAPMDVRGQPTERLRRGAFDPSIDWIYLDTDADGVRDAGADAGYTDEIPALGEPLFVPDDVNLDGVLGPEERVVRLGTSKVQRYWVNVQYGRRFEHEYVRGTDLSSVQRDYTGGIYGYADTLHGTGVAGILIGDVPLVGRRWVGIAPEAELVHTFSIGTEQTDPLLYVLRHAPDVVLHEYVDWTRSPLDGSDAVSTLIDASSDDDEVAHVCPAGNIGGSAKHAHVELDMGASRDLEFTMPDGTQQVELSLFHRADVTPILALVEPDTTVHALDTEMEALETGGDVYAGRASTTRGFVQTSIVLYERSTTLRSGTWSIRASAPADAPVVLDTFVADERSGFGLGVAWAPDVATDRSTIAAPATADRCLGVGSTPAHTADEDVFYMVDDTRAGAVRGYSARGPRIDGFASLDLLAPDNPWSTLGAGDVFPMVAPGALVAPEGAYMVFGGTSGAGPHAAGVAALLREQGARGAGILTALRESAVSDATTGPVPNDDYGRGRLDAAGALGVEAAGQRPTLTLRAEPAQVAPGATVRLVPQADDPDGDALELRWDDGYDGTWDLAFAPVAPRELRFDTRGVQRIKAQVRDSTGRIAEAAVVIYVGVDAPMPDAGPMPDASVPDAGAPSGGGGEGCGCRAGAGALREGWPGLGLLGLCALAAARRRRVRLCAPACARS